MRALLPTLAVLLLLTGTADADCNQAAYAVAAQYGGAQILSVKQQGNTCIITVLVPGAAGQPPRVETVRVPG